MNSIIRKIEQKDNAEVAALIRNVLIEHNVPKVGTAYADTSLDCMFETYSVPNAQYFVVEKDGRLIGGAGIATLENGPSDTCELQKMYFLPEARGTGMGSAMMEKCLAFAKEAGFANATSKPCPIWKPPRSCTAKADLNISTLLWAIQAIAHAPCGC